MGLTEVLASLCVKELRIFFFKDLFPFLFVGVYMYERGVYEGQKKSSDHLGLKLMVIVSSPKWVPET